MTMSVGTGLARITIASPRRRVDIALPEAVNVADLLPAILRTSGEELADDGQRHGGWMLRRETGVAVDPTKSLSAQDVRDGEILHLTPRETAWPELDYDDVVDAIATDARNRNRAWQGSSTRLASLVFATAVLVGIELLLLAWGGDWFAIGTALLVGAVALLAGGIALSRALADAGAGAVIASGGVAYAGLGGLLVLADGLGLRELDPAHYLVAGAALVLSGLAAYIGVAHQTQIFVAAMTLGLLIVLAAAAAALWELNATSVAAVLAALTLTLMPAFPLLAIRLGKLPVPSLPTSTEELLADPPHPARSRVQATVKRSDEIFHGLFLGSSVVVLFCEYQLITSGNTSALWFAGIVAVLTSLRARLLPAVAHRLPLLIAGFGGLGMLLAAASLRLAAQVGPWVIVPIAVVAALLVAATGLFFARNKPTPFFTRWADIFDIVLMLSVVPIMALVVGLFGYIRGIFG